MFFLRKFCFSYLTILKTTREKKSPSNKTNCHATRYILTYQFKKWKILLFSQIKGWHHSYFIFCHSFCTCFCYCGSKSLPLWSVMVEVITSSFWDFEACFCLHSWFRGQWGLQQWTELFHTWPSVISRWGPTQSTTTMGGWTGVRVNRDYTINLFSVLYGGFFVIEESSEKDISLAVISCSSFPGSSRAVSKQESSHTA